MLKYKSNIVYILYSKLDCHIGVSLMYSFVCKYTYLGKIRLNETLQYLFIFVFFFFKGFLSVCSVCLFFENVFCIDTL